MLAVLVLLEYWFVLPVLKFAGCWFVLAVLVFAVYNFFPCDLYVHLLHLCISLRALNLVLGVLNIFTTITVQQIEGDQN